MTVDTNTVLSIMIMLATVCNAIISLFTKKDIKTLEINTNSKMDSLLVTTGALARAQGVVEGRKQEREESKSDNK